MLTILRGRDLDLISDLLIPFCCGMELKQSFVAVLDYWGWMDGWLFSGTMRKLINYNETMMTTSTENGMMM